MTSTGLQQDANKLRQEKKYDEALPLYEELWNKTGDHYDGAGLLNCLRKLKQYNKAIPFADELVKKFPDFQWAKNEATWTYIEGRLNKLEDDIPVDKIIEIASAIMRLKPEGFAAKMVVFKVLKAAKATSEWKTVDEWTDKINPEVLSTVPMIDEEGREGWTDQSLWYNYKAKALIENEKPEDVLLFIDDVISKFPRQKKFFMRFKALSYYKLGKMDDAVEIYKSLCNVRRPDWWLLYEYAKVLRDMGNKEEALKLMYCASNGNPTLKLMVTLFADIGVLCNEMGKNEEARAHFILCREIRKENQWSVSSAINDSISGLNRIIGTANEPVSLKEALKVCRNEWNKALRKEQSSVFKRDKDQKRINLIGRIILGKSDRPFCFITDKNNETYFCLKSDLPHNINNGDEVIFNAIPSFDKKKNKESWKAVDIRKN